MWPDNETTNDLIGFQVHADLIRTVVTDKAMLPTAIGVFGDWGGGKTSIMKMLERDLDPQRWGKDSEEHKRYKNVAVVYVNTWIFEGYDDAKTAIISSILLELAKHERFGSRVRDTVLSLHKSLNWMRVVRMGIRHIAIPAILGALTGGVAAIPAAIAVSTGLVKSTNPTGSDTGEENKENKEKVELDEAIKKDLSQPEEMDVRTFRQRFGKMLSDGGIEVLVVLIDDLDRCTPERIIDNLEAVKLFLSVEQTAFVIGADRRIVEHAIRSRYAEQYSDSIKPLETEQLVKDYLEKLVQVPYRLPWLSATEIETYMTLLFCQRHLQSKEFEKCLKASRKTRDDNRYASFGYRDVCRALEVTELDPELTSSLTLAATSARLIADGLKGNPRQVKRFLNALVLRKELARVAQLKNIRDDILVKLMLLEYVHTQLFVQLFTWQSQQEGCPEQIEKLEEILVGPEGNVDDEKSARDVDPNWATTAVRKWIAMDPILKEVDLRDYFWVARDRLESSFTGISMVSPIVRTILDALLSGSKPKRIAAVTDAKNLAEDEIASLLTLIDQAISRQPSETVGYDVLRDLIDAGVNQAAERLVSILMQRPLDHVPPGVGVSLITIHRERSELKEILSPAIEHILKSNTKISTAVRSATKRKG